mgnify:CR=1 FL=1
MYDVCCNLLSLLMPSQEQETKKPQTRQQLFTVCTVHYLVVNQKSKERVDKESVNQPACIPKTTVSETTTRKQITLLPTTTSNTTDHARNISNQQDQYSDDDDVLSLENSVSYPRFDSIQCFSKR